MAKYNDFNTSLHVSPVKYDRQRYLLHQWSVQLDDVMYRIENYSPMTVKRLSMEISPDNYRDLLEYAIKGAKQAVLDADSPPVRRDMYEDMQ